MIIKFKTPFQLFSRLADKHPPALFWQSLLLVLSLLSLNLLAQSSKTGSHAVSIHGKPKYSDNFKHLAYVNPNAPKGGKVVLGALGSFDNLNPFIIKGESGDGIGNIYDTLTASTLDEKSVEYGLLAERIHYDDTRRWVAFTLRKEARWHDGKPVTPADVIWTFNALVEKGAPFYRVYYKNVKSVTQTAPRVVRFDFSTANHELPLILGQLVILPKHYWATRDFSKTTLKAPLGSGPYKIKNVRPGKSITYERMPDYWGRNVPIKKGFDNFDEIRYDYYKSLDIIREALRSGKIDFLNENNSKAWATSYDITAVKNGLLKKSLIPDKNPQGVQGFVFNIRKNIFKDRRVRAALAYAFDFEWSNRVLFYNAYTRANSYFNNSELSAKGLPSPAELKILKPYKGRIPDEVFTQVYTPPQTDGSGNIRANLRKATALLNEAGWTVQNGMRVHNTSGKRMEFKILLVLAAFERIVNPFVQNMKKLGIKVQVATINTAQYENIVQKFDFDMIIGTFGQSSSPGNEQRDFWSSQAAQTPGSRNLIGIQNPVIDEVVEKLIATRTRTELLAHTRALDRILRWEHYIIPQWYIASFRVLYWERFGKPKTAPPYGVPFTAWWIDAEKARALSAQFSFTR